MKFKKILALVVIIVLVGTTSIVVLASNATNNLPVGQSEVINAKPTVINVNIEEHKEKAITDAKIPERLLDIFSRFQDGEMPDFGEWGLGRGFNGKKTELNDEQKAKIEECLTQAIEDGKIPTELQEIIDGFLNGEITELTDEQKNEIKSVMESYMAQAVADGKIPAELQEIIDGFLNGEITELTDEQKDSIKSILESYVSQAMEDGKIPKELADIFNSFKNGEMPNFGDWEFGRGRGFNGDRSEAQFNIQERLEQFMEGGKIPAEMQEMIDGLLNGEFPDFGERGMGRGFKGNMPDMTSEQISEILSNFGLNGDSMPIFNFSRGR